MISYVQISVVILGDGIEWGSGVVQVEWPKVRVRGCECLASIQVKNEVSLTYLASI